MDEIEVNINGKNRTTLEGYVTRMKYDADKARLVFNLVHISTSVKRPGVPYTMTIPVFFYNKAAEELSQRVREAQYVETEAKLRGVERVIDIEDLYKKGIKHYTYTEYQLIGTHITGAEHIKGKIKLPATKEPE